MTYEILKEVTSTDDVYHISYGIVVYSETEEGKTATILMSVRDMTEDRQEIAELVSLCNHLELSPLHLHDVVEDFLNIRGFNVTVSQDLPEYIMDKDIVRVALRTAKDVDATDEEWQEFIAHLEERRRKIQEDK